MVLRGFWNLSLTPRQWGIGHKIDNLLKIYSKEIKDLLLSSLKANQDLTHKAINSNITTHLQSLSNNIIMFEQYDLWLFDSTKAAHQVYCGEKLAVFSYIPKGHIPIKREVLEKLNYISYLFSGDLSPTK